MYLIICALQRLTSAAYLVDEDIVGKTQRAMCLEHALLSFPFHNYISIYNYSEPNFCTSSFGTMQQLSNLHSMLNHILLYST